MPEESSPRSPIRIKNTLARLPYMWNEGGGDSSDPPRSFSGSREAHGKRLLKQLRKVSEETEELHATSLADDYLAERGFLLTFTIDPRFKSQLQTLDSVTSGVELLNVKQFTGKDKRLLTEATVFVAHGSLSYFVKRLTKYKDEEKSKDFVDPIEQIGQATLSSLWTSNQPLPDEVTAVWWEVWLRRGRSAETRENNIEAVEAECQRLNLRLKEDRLHLPEHTILLLKAKKSELAGAFGILNCVAELRSPARAILANPPSPSSTSPITSTLASPAAPPTEAPSVCVLDTGVNRAHPLLSTICLEKDCDSWDPEWTIADDHGHGTEMCGLAAYGDLRAVRAQEAETQASHWIESVKLLDFSTPHEPEHYGAVTVECMGRIESNRSDRTNRVFSMAVTAEDAPDFPDLAPDGLPTSWSSSIDQATASALDPDGPRRIFVVSGGNVLGDDADGFTPETYLIVNHEMAFQDPAHSWNAITVGAITNYEDPDEPCLAKKGALSPYSRTTSRWLEFGGSDCPLKPDVVFEGGNVHVDSAHRDDGIQLVSLNHEFLANSPFKGSNATSAATAGVAHLTARIHAAFPQAWPETVRGLLLGSGRWNQEMLRGIDLKKKSSVTRLVRTYGFGEPDIERATSCQRSRATFYFEEEIQPFKKEEGGSGIVTNEMLFFPIPVPNETLEELGSTKIRLRITLSYFIEPNPGRKGLAKSKFRYANCGLRFDLKTETESIDTFVANRSKKILEKLEREKGNRGAPSKGWLIGSNNQDRGSVHHDIWEGSAASLASRDAIVVYPVNGWWKVRPQLGRGNDKQRFSMVVTLETDDESYDLFTAVEQEIEDLKIPQRITEIQQMFATSIEVEV